MVLLMALMVGTPPSMDAAAYRTEPTPEDPPPASHPTQSSDEALAADAAMIARDTGWSQEEAEAWLRFQAVTGELVAKLRRAYPDSFAAAWLDPEGSGPHQFVRFVGRVPDEARALAREMGVEVAFSDDGVVSERDLVARGNAISDDLRAAGYGNFAVAAVPTKDMIRVSITRAPGDRGKSDEELREDLPASARAPDVVVRFSDDPVVVRG